MFDHMFDQCSNSVRPLHGRLPIEEQLICLHGSLRRRLRQVLQRLAAKSAALECVRQQHSAALHAAVAGCVDQLCLLLTNRLQTKLLRFAGTLEPSQLYSKL